MRKVPVTGAVGMILCHDITRIVPGSEKGRAFRKGHVISPEDVPELQALGKEHIYVWEIAPDMVHEDEAALRLARSAAGPGLSWNEPNQGKVNLKAEYEGLLKVRVDQLRRVNSIENIVFATLHNNRAVSRGDVVAGTRIIPLAIPSGVLEEAARWCAGPEKLLEVKPYQSMWVGVVTTGREVYEGRIRDGFYDVLRKKTAPYGARMLGQVIVPDDPDVITQEIRQMIDKGAELVLVTGGMSVDPDDVTPLGIRSTGAEAIFYGAPVLPGSMFMLAYIGHVPVCGLPGCVMFNKTTILDLMLPRLFAGERISRDEVIELGHGGLCRECADCTWPNCSFGKT
jgi:molybdenum cofactor synthesis domain-containing protein